MCMERREATRMNTGAQPAALQRGGSGGCASWSGGHSWPPSLRGSWLCRWESAGRSACPGSQMQRPLSASRQFPSCRANVPSCDTITSRFPRSALKKKGKTTHLSSGEPKSVRTVFPGSLAICSLLQLRPDISTIRETSSAHDGENRQRSKNESLDETVALVLANGADLSHKRGP